VEKLPTYFTLGELWLDGGPGLALGGIAEEVHDDGAAADGLVDLEEVLAGDPAVLNGVLPGLAILAHTNDDVQAVVAKVEALAVTLRAVADEGKGVVLEVVLYSKAGQPSNEF
jgi:hypothetical protein